MLMLMLVMKAQLLSASHQSAV